MQTNKYTSHCVFVSINRDTNIFINWESKDIVPSVSLFLPDDQNTEVKEDWVSGDFQTEINFKTTEFGKTIKIRF